MVKKKQKLSSTQVENTLQEVAVTVSMSTIGYVLIQNQHARYLTDSSYFK